MATATETTTPHPPAHPSSSRPRRSGRAIVLRGITFETYHQIRFAEGNERLRMTYLDGTLWIMSPGLRHDGSSRRFGSLIIAVARARRVPILPTGGTTLHKRGPNPQQGAGKEPDEGYYLGVVEARVRDHEELDFAVDPLPNLAIEVDNTRATKRALATYARLGIPEVWVYKVKPHQLRILRLEGATYAEVGRSVALPWLTPGLVLDALAARREQPGGHLGWLDWLDAWARALPDPPAAD